MFRNSVVIVFYLKITPRNQSDQEVDQQRPVLPLFRKVKGERKYLKCKVFCNRCVCFSLSFTFTFSGENNCNYTQRLWLHLQLVICLWKGSGH